MSQIGSKINPQKFESQQSFALSIGGELSTFYPVGFLLPGNLPPAQQHIQLGSNSFDLQIRSGSGQILASIGWRIESGAGSGYPAGIATVSNYASDGRIGIVTDSSGSHIVGDWQFSLDSSYFVVWLRGATSYWYQANDLRVSKPIASLVDRLFGNLAVAPRSVVSQIASLRSSPDGTSIAGISYARSFITQDGIDAIDFRSVDAEPQQSFDINASYLRGYWYFPPNGHTITNFPPTIDSQLGFFIIGRSTLDGTAGTQTIIAANGSIDATRTYTP